MPRERTAEEQADDLLEAFSRKEGRSLRTMGILDRARRSVVARRETVFSDMPRIRRPVERDE